MVENRPPLNPVAHAVLVRLPWSVTSAILGLIQIVKFLELNVSSLSETYK